MYLLTYHDLQRKGEGGERLKLTITQGVFRITLLLFFTPTFLLSLYQRGREKKVTEHTKRTMRFAMTSPNIPSGYGSRGEQDYLPIREYTIPNKQIHLTLPMIVYYGKRSIIETYSFKRQQALEFRQQNTR
jgi:hypothetical protein